MSLKGVRLHACRTGCGRSQGAGLTGKQQQKVHLFNKHKYIGTEPRQLDVHSYKYSV